MKKRLQLLTLLAFIGALGFSACSEIAEPVFEETQEIEDIFDPRATDGEEEDSIRN